MDPGRKSSEYRRSLDAQDRRRSVELARSTRRYDEHWGAAERADTRLKCSDNVIHHVHSQIISCWSPVLRDMINLVPTHGLLESTHGLAYVLQVQEDSVAWGAVLDMIYPVVSSIQDWELYERVLLLADKYNMTGVLQRCVQRLCQSDISYCLEAAAPNFVLRWMALSDKLQLHQLSSHLTGWLQPHLTTLACHPDSLSSMISYARDNLGRDLLLQLFSLSLQVAASAAQAAAAAGGSNGMNGSMNLMQASAGLGSGGSKSRSGGSRRQRRRTNDWVMGEDEQAGEQDLAHVLGFNMLPSVHDDSPSSSGDNQYNDDGGYGDSATSLLDSPGGSLCGREGDGGELSGTKEMQQRLAMCMTSGLFGPVAVPGAPAAATATASVGAMRPPNAPVSAAAAAVQMSGSTPMVSYAPIISTAPASFNTQQQQQQQQPSIPRMGAMGFPMSIPPSRSRPAAPCLESVMEVDGGEHQQQQQFPGSSSGWAAKLLPGERRRSLAF